MLAKLLGALIGVVIVSIAVPAFAEPPPIFVGGQFIRQHAIDDGRGHLLVPIRGVFEVLGASVVYVPRRIVAVRKDNVIIAGLEIGRRTAIVRNRPRTLDVAPLRRNGRVYVPLRSVAEMAGATVQYSSNPRLVDIRLPNNELTPTMARRTATDEPSDSTLPIWIYILVGVFVLGFLLEIGRRLVQGGSRRPPSMAARSGAALSARALQLPYPPDSRD